MVFNSSQHVSHFNLCLPISHPQRPFQLQLSWSRTYLFSSQAQQLVWIDFRHFAWLKGKTPQGLVLNFKLSWYLRPSINHGGCSVYHFKSMTIYLVVLKPSRRFFKNKIFFFSVYYATHVQHHRDQMKCWIFATRATDYYKSWCGWWEPNQVFRKSSQWWY